MKINSLLSVVLITLFSFSTSFAGKYKKAKPTIATPEEDFYDVKYVKLDIKAVNTSTAIIGHTTTVANVVTASMNVYAFELSSQLTIDSAKVDGNLLPVQSTGHVHKISLSTPIAQNNSFTAEVWYHGQPTGGTGFFTNGLLNQTDASIPVQVTHTVSAAYHSKDWWACKQSLSDKIDSTDIWVTVPTGLKVAGNGLLKNVTNISSTENRYEWALRSVVDYYLISFAIAPYDEYNYQMHFVNGDSMLIQNYIYNHPAVLQQHKDELDSIENLINYFSAIFGKYPFYKEKFGICQAPLGGGMENQTMVSLGSLDMSLIAHELAHQWWGDNVTCHSLEDMWLNEGWATYSEHLYLEQFHSVAAAFNYRNQVFNAVVGSLGGSVWVDDTTSEFRIYDGRLTYYKGAALAHMLRYMIHNDAQFFQIITTYQQQYADGTATTEDLKNLASQISGVPLDTFFHQWYKSEGYPTYGAKWYQDAAGNVTIRLTQTTSRPTSVPFFKMPVEIKLTSAQGDTTVRLINTQTPELFLFHWGKTMTGMSIDPDNHILNRVATITNDPALTTKEIQKNAIHIYPNPSATGWNVSQLPQNAKLKLLDMHGRVVWDCASVNDTILIPSAALSPGTYILQIQSEKQPTVNYYLSR